MKTKTIGRVLLSAAFLMGASSVATAGVTAVGTHLKCYQGKDTVGVKHTYSGGTLLSSVGLPPESNCKIKTPPKICCAPVDKIGFVDEDGNPPPGGGPTGATGKFCCYALSCKDNQLTTLSQQDQFGSHTLVGSTKDPAMVLKPKLICAPASPSGAFLDPSSPF
jgi:hypothetical protein